MSKQREIKFRAWTQDGRMLEQRTDDMDLSFGKEGYGLHNPFLTVMQYTGLKDKNGEEIYEGDILSHFDKKYIVKWDGYMAAFQASNPADGVDTDFFNWSHIPSLRTKGVPGVFSERDDPNCEVIGNIYENPELLTTNP